MQTLLAGGVFGFGMMAMAGAMAHAETVEIPHRFGITRIENTPERVVSLSYIGHDFVLALGVVPVGLRYWYGPYDFGVWPWAQEALGDAQPAVLYGAIDVEQIALLEPDLILGQWSGMTEREYKMLSVIAPTVPPAAGQSDYSSPWQMMHERIGMALGRQDLARAQIAAVEARFEALRAAHPDWHGKTASFVWPVQIGAFSSHDIRGQFLENLGFHIPQAVDDLVNGENFYVVIPRETLEPIDTDVLVWAHTPAPEQALSEILLRPMMRARREGREVLIDEVLSSAMAHSSPLALNFALDYLAPALAAAADGDPHSQTANAHARTIAPEEGDAAYD